MDYYSKTDVITHNPLSHKEEIGLFKRYYAGDPKNMSADALEARNIIIENNLRYAALTALRHSTNRKYNADLTSCANAGLIKALESRRHAPERGRFTTYATKFILGEIKAFFRVACSVTFPAGKLPDWNEDGSEDPDVETMQDPKALLPEHIDHSSLREAVASLSPTERQMVEFIFFQGYSVTAAAELVQDEDGEIGISRQWATELRDRALVKLRLAMGVPQKVSENDEVEIAEEEKEAA